METIIRNRTIRPSSRLEKSKSYKIDTKIVSKNDILIVKIDHESKAFSESYKFKGGDIAGRNSISFRVTDYGTHIDISWSGAQPFGKPERVAQTSIYKKNEKQDAYGEFKLGLSPIVNTNSKVLILGTFPGKDSLEKQEYYANKRNLFWKMIEYVSETPIPKEYNEKINLLHEKGIALWDVCKSCQREGSLDNDILFEIPNEMENFLREHPSIKFIAFNGRKALKLYLKHFEKIDYIPYVPLSSSSPANTTKKKQEKLDDWLKIKQYL